MQLHNFIYFDETGVEFKAQYKSVDKRLGDPVTIGAKAIIQPWHQGVLLFLIQSCTK